jgi:hypothetical protein
MAWWQYIINHWIYRDSAKTLPHVTYETLFVSQILQIDDDDDDDDDKLWGHSQHKQLYKEYVLQAHEQQ